MRPQEIGKLGEKIAVKYLKKKGYKILDRNFEFRAKGIKRGELDVVARKNGVVVFVEVKALKRDDNTFQPEDRIDFRKKKDLIKTAELWLAKNNLALDSEWQIDVVSVRLDFQTRKAKISHFPSAICC